MSKEAMKLALEALEGIQRYGLDTLSGRSDGPDDRDWQRAGVNEMTKRARLGITALQEALAKPDFWEGYVPEPVKPAQQCKWPTCQSEEYQQALAEQIKRELVDEQPAQRTWQGLTDEEIEQGCKESWVTEQAWQSAVWWAEAKLKEKNT